MEIRKSVKKLVKCIITLEDEVHRTLDLLEIETINKKPLDQSEWAEFFFHYKELTNNLPGGLPN